MAATYLHRACLAMTDMGYGDYRLHYVRTLDKQELDFVITPNNRPIAAIEVNTDETAVAKTLKNREKWFPHSGNSNRRQKGNPGEAYG